MSTFIIIFFSDAFLLLLEIIVGTLQRSCFYSNSIKVKLAKQGIGLVWERVRENQKIG